jgi:hyperosmotically inducible protein
MFLFGCRTNESPEAQVKDLEITAQVKSKLASDVGLSSATNISVNSTNGVVTLSGQVDTADLKSRAEATAKSVPNVVRVVNSLQVATSPAAAVSRGTAAPGLEAMRLRLL